MSTKEFGDFAIGDILNNVWCIVRTLGKGTCCIVYEVKSHDCIGAVKVYKKEEKYLPVYYRELNILRLLHKDAKITSIVKLYSHFIHKGHPCLVFELLHFGLRQIIYKNNDDSLSLYVIQSLAKDLLQSVDYIHSKGLIHADIKPDNLLWSVQDGCIKVIDFGLCMQQGNQEYCHQIQSLCYQCPEAKRWNTFICKNPEVFVGGPICGPAADIWTIGCVLVYMYTAHKLFGKDDVPENGCDKCQVCDSTLRCEYEVLVDSVIKPRQHDDDIPNQNAIMSDFRDLVQRMLCCHSDHRITATDALHHPFFQHHLQASYKDMLLFPTRILRLLNTVEQKDLDDEYQDIVDDIKEECEKYGHVNKLVIPRYGQGIDKVYIEFDDSTSCEEAQHCMMGKYFNGRTVITTYFPIKLFKDGDYY
ncbi:serine/threonine-protein kinase Kist-like [Saccoglossus kowalevskii]|uniref:Serine/threonine-protein kinase Kist-like n=1 Tax=Saccoglossus kowalevskii TaxID=10224 RepID=A0ABM0MAU5_SACKO|nr:PREDICTED: serine/threonine-protein kinase Kist-like [Saccoglossus kowalevskii]